MTESDDGEKPVFHVGQVYPRISDYDRAWSLDGVAVIKLIEESCFWGFLGWFRRDSTGGHARLRTALQCRDPLAGVRDGSVRRRGDASVGSRRLPVVERPHVLTSGSRIGGVLLQAVIKC
jgi:hypothetical protein